MLHHPSPTSSSSAWEAYSSYLFAGVEVGPNTIGMDLVVVSLVVGLDTLEVDMVLHSMATIIICSMHSSSFYLVTVIPWVTSTHNTMVNYTYLSP
jgi:hypothetical protein